MIAQQLVFGYRDGHRPLVGSIELDKTASAALLGATDATIGPRTERLLSALPLPSAGLYALCGTWPAPEAGRPGAVWAHALLVPLDGLAEVEDVEAVSLALRRPSADALADFTLPIEIQRDAAPRPAEPDMLAQLLAAAIEPDGVPVVVTSDLAAGEAALFALWNGAWAELRASLSFRTRERVKATPELDYLCVARRVTGMWRQKVAATQLHASALAQTSWLRELAWAERPGRKPGVREFLRAFGPDAPAGLDRLVALGELHDVALLSKPRRLARTLAANHPEATDEASLKRALFGRKHADWWDPPERDVVLAIFAVGAKGFDVKALDVANRTQRLVAAGYGIDLVEALPARGPRRLRSLLLEALIAEATPNLLSEVMSVEPTLGEEIAVARPDLLETRETWSIASDDQALVLATSVVLSDRAIAAAVMADRFAAIEPVVSLPAAALRLARARELSALRKLFDQRVLAGAFGGKEAEELRIQVAAAGVETGSLGELLDALDARRHRIDDAWLAAAVHALGDAGKKRQGRALEVVFGPLHHAVTDGRLPDDLWVTLEKIAPPGNDPGLRMRRLLVNRARKEGWPRKALDRALRASGPEIKKLKAEIDDVDDDDPFVATAKAVLKSWKRLV